MNNLILTDAKIRHILAMQLTFRCNRLSQLQRLVISLHWNFCLLAK